MLYYVLPWKASAGDWYDAADALAVYKRESAAERKADKLNASGVAAPDGVVVRSSNYVRAETPANA